MARISWVFEVWRSRSESVQAQSGLRWTKAGNGDRLSPMNRVIMQGPPRQRTRIYFCGVEWVKNMCWTM